MQKMVLRNPWICIRLLDEISVFVRKETEKELIMSLLAKDDCIAQIESYYHRIEASIASFQVCIIPTRTVSLNLRLRALLRRSQQ